MSNAFAGLVAVCAVGAGVLTLPVAAAATGEDARRIVAISTGGMTPLGLDEVLVVSIARKPSFVRVPSQCQLPIPVQVVMTHAETGVPVQVEQGVLEGDTRLFESSYEMTVDRSTLPADAQGERVLFQAAALVPGSARICIEVNVDVLALTALGASLNTKFNSVASTVNSTGALDPVSGAIVLGLGALVGLGRRKSGHRAA